MDATTFAIGALPSVFDFLGNALETRRQDRMMAQGLESFNAARTEQRGVQDRQFGELEGAFRRRLDRIGGDGAQARMDVRRAGYDAGQGLRSGLVDRGLSGGTGGGAMGMMGMRGMQDRLRGLESGLVNRQVQAGSDLAGVGALRPYTGADPNVILSLMQGLG